MMHALFALLLLCFWGVWTLSINGSPYIDLAPWDWYLIAAQIGMGISAHA